MFVSCVCIALVLRLFVSIDGAPISCCAFIAAWLIDIIDRERGAAVVLYEYSIVFVGYMWLLLEEALLAGFVESSSGILFLDGRAILSLSDIEA